MWSILGGAASNFLTPRVVETSDFANLLASEEPQTVAEAPNLVASLFRMLGALGIVLGLILLGFWLLKRFGKTWNKTTNSLNPGVEILNQRSIGHRRQLMVVRWEGRRLLLGATPESIHTLASEIDTEGMTETESFGRELSEAIGGPERELVGSGSRR